jgi:hypothetical protein
LTESLYSEQIGSRRTPTKSLTLSNGTVSTSYYVTVLLTDESKVDVPLSYNGSGLVGKAVKVTYKQGAANVAATSSSGVYGTVNAYTLSVGSDNAFASGAKILEIDDYGNTCALSVSRLSGVYLASDSVLLATKDANGKITGMI